MKIVVGISGFRGELPLVTPRLKPVNVAQVAVAAKLLRGSVQAWRVPAITQTLPKADSDG